VNGGADVLLVRVQMFVLRKLRVADRVAYEQL
jgi:hypothetical protein